MSRACFPPPIFSIMATLSILIGGPLKAQPSPEMVDRFFDDVYFKFNPTQGTSAGFHQYDAQLEDYSKAGLNTNIKALRRAERQFAALPADPDRDLILNYIRASLLDMEKVRTWQKNPDNYSSGVTDSIFVVMSRNFAPAGGSPEIRDRARAPDPGRVRCGPRESQKPAPHLHRSRD